MIPLPWLIAGALALAAASGYVAFGIGKDVERNAWLERDLQTASKVIVKQEVLIREVPKIVVKTVTQEKIVEKEIDRVALLIPHALASTCVLPDRYGELLIGAARGLEPNPATGRIDETSGDYRCIEVLEATLRDLRAGAQNTARLAGLQEFVRLLQ